jgi:hypothetical protein
MTRIRYIKKETTLVSTKPILCNNRFVTVTLDLDTMKYKLTDSTTNEVITQGVGADTATLKRNAKKDLRSIGATFLDEVRNTHGERKLVIEATNN